MSAEAAWHTASGVAAKMEESRAGAGAGLMAIFDDALRHGRSLQAFTGNDMAEIINKAPPGFVRRMQGESNQGEAP